MRRTGRQQERAWRTSVRRVAAATLAIGALSALVFAPGAGAATTSQTTATTISAAKAGKFGTHAYSIQLSDDSVRLLHSKYIPDNIWSDIETARTQIIGGKLKVDAIWDALTVRAMMTSVAAPPK